MDRISSSLSDYVEQISRVGGELAPMIVKGMLLLLIVLLLIKYLGKILSKILTGMGMPERRAAYSVTVLHILVLLIGALVILNMVGFPGALLFRVIMVIVMISIASFIIARPFIPRLPFKKGNIIQIGSFFGVVDMISIMHTRIRTFEGKLVYIPNQKVLNDMVTNFSERPNRRLDIDFFIPYTEDVENVKDVVGKILQDDDIVLEKPAPRVVIDKFSPNYMEMKARFWVKRKYALTGRWGLNAKIKESFDREGIRMAPPRLEILNREGDEAEA